MRKISVREARNSLGQLDKTLLLEGELIITRHGQPIAKIVPLENKQMPSHRALRRATSLLTTPSSELLAADRERL